MVADSFSREATTIDGGPGLLSDGDTSESSESHFKYKGGFVDSLQTVDRNQSISNAGRLYTPGKLQGKITNE